MGKHLDLSSVGQSYERAAIHREVYPVLRALADLLDWRGTLAGLVEVHDRGGVL